MAPDPTRPLKQPGDPLFPILTPSTPLHPPTLHTASEETDNTMVGLDQDCFAFAEVTAPFIPRPWQGTAGCGEGMWCNDQGSLITHPSSAPTGRVPQPLSPASTPPRYLW